MNVLLICQCDKRALTQTRRILDQFAERRGHRTWQTPITQAGLDTLRKLLRKTARKNTAVACHWIRGRDHSELLWIVGDASRFNAEGAVPTNATARDVLRRKDENDWHSQQDIYLLSAMAALLHDLGKASVAFQRRLLGKLQGQNLYRHEWVSLRLFQAFVGQSASDEEWLLRLLNPSPEDDRSWTMKGRLLADGLDVQASTSMPFADMPPLARAIAWLVVTHHRLPAMPSWDEHGQYRPLGASVSGFRAERLDNLIAQIACDWNELPRPAERKEVASYWSFDSPLPVTTPKWRQRAARLAQRLLTLTERSEQRDWMSDPYIMHLARLGLMLADHHYSSLTTLLDRERGERDYPLYANTNRDTGELNQPLDEHLLGVEKHAGTVIRSLPEFSRALPHLARHKGLKRRSSQERFRWQDRATDVATAIRQRSSQQGAFIVNMASTGCGKTFANARIMNALAEPAVGMRCSFALGLRALTLQTGRAFRDLLHLSDDDLAIKVGGGANRELFEYYERQAEQRGSASAQDLLPEDEDSRVLFEGNDGHPLLQRLTHDARVRSLLAAPVLVCTVDHLTPATESQRGGRQIAPMLRLLSGDLVLDEPDDFDINDLPALSRLVHWAGLLGSRVLLSSATLPPAIVEGLFLAYLDGRRWFQRNRGERPGEMPNICCMWVDEFRQSSRDCANADQFRIGHADFAERRHARLGLEPVRRRAGLLPLNFAVEDKTARRREFASKIRDAAMGLHALHHGKDPRTGKRVSFGLVRMANIAPLFDVALALFAQGVAPGFRIHLCVYHSQFPLLIRSAIEHRLDTALNRGNSAAVFELEEIRHRLDASEEPDQLFIVLGSPVTEVGRDHDYDWAVVEPSSMRSLIQLAGRIRRHRPGTVEDANLLVFDSNLRHFERTGQPAYCKPGFESSNDDVDFRLKSHRLEELLEPSERDVIDSRPRIVSRSKRELRPTNNLVDLEHARLAAQMLPPAQVAAALNVREQRYGIAPPRPEPNAATHWNHPQVSLTAVMLQQQPFRAEGGVSYVDLVLLPNEDEDDFVLCRVDPGKRKWEAIYADIESNQNHRVPDEQLTGERIQVWGVEDYWQLLLDHAESEEIPIRRCAERYGTVRLPDSKQGWRFHPALGFTAKS